MTSSPDRFLGSFTKVKRRVADEVELNLGRQLFLIKMALYRLDNRGDKLLQAVGLCGDTSHAHRGIPLRYEAVAILGHIESDRHGIK